MEAKFKHRLRCQGGTHRPIAAGCPCQARSGSAETFVEGSQTPPLISEPQTMAAARALLELSSMQKKGTFNVSQHDSQQLQRVTDRLKLPPSINLQTA